MEEHTATEAGCGMYDVDISTLILINFDLEKANPLRGDVSRSNPTTTEEAEKCIACIYVNTFTPLAPPIQIIHPPSRSRQAKICDAYPSPPPSPSPSPATQRNTRKKVYHGWSPNGAERFVELVQDDYFTDVALFRCVKNFLVQFGIAPDASSPKKKYWRQKGTIKDDPSLGIEFKR